jgi:hypothetical protein
MIHFKYLCAMLSALELKIEDKDTVLKIQIGYIFKDMNKVIL